MATRKDIETTGTLLFSLTDPSKPATDLDWVDVDVYEFGGKYYAIGSSGAAGLFARTRGSSWTTPGSGCREIERWEAMEMGLSDLVTDEEFVDAFGEEKEDVFQRYYGATAMTS